MQKEKNVRSEEGLTGKRTGESEWRGRYKYDTLYSFKCNQQDATLYNISSMFHRAFSLTVFNGSNKSTIST
jgi:hypothetical protein